MAGQHEKPDFIVDPSGRAQDIRHTRYASPPGPPDVPPRDSTAGRLQPLSPKKRKRTTYVIWIPVGLILSLVALGIRQLIISQSDGHIFTSESAYHSFQSGNYSYFRGEYDDAIFHYNMAVSSESDVGDVYNARGLAYLAQGKHDRALADFDRALELMPDSAMVYNNRALVHLATGDYDLAIADLDRAIALQANFGKAYYNRGLAYQATGDYDQAIADLTQAVEFSSYWSSLWRAVPTEERSGLERTLSEGIDEQLAATQIRVDLPSALYQRALAYLAIGDHERALADLKEAAKLSPSMGDLPEALALAYAAGAETPPAPTSPTATHRALPTETATAAPTSRAVSMSAWASRGLVGGEVMALAIDPLSPTTLYAGMSDGRVFKSTDGGENWSAAHAGLAGARVQALVVDPETPTTLYAGTASGVYKSTNRARTWTHTGLNANIGVLIMDPVGPMALYAGSDGGGVYKSADGGANWGAINTGLTPPLVVALTIDPQTPNTLYAGTHDYTHHVSMRYYPGYVYKSTDRGRNWSSVTWGYTHYLALAVDPGTPATLYAGTSTGLYKSADGGESWSAANTGLAASSVYALAIDPLRPTTIYAGTNGGVYLSGDGGGSWSSVNAGLTNTDIRALAIDPATPGRVYAGTWGGGVFVLQQEGVP
jgi:tetratricopeptide (TPR) repeat protein